eukprot:COSAG01_NODE_2631_length_7340_cov_35.191686_2_plen_121_part_00
MFDPPGSGPVVADDSSPSLSTLSADIDSLMSEYTDQQPEAAPASAPPPSAGTRGAQAAPSQPATAAASAPPADATDAGVGSAAAQDSSQAFQGPDPTGAPPLTTTARAATHAAERGPRVL